MATKTVSITTGGNNNATVTASEINALATDFIADGVVGAISLNTGSGGSGSFAVNAQGTPDMTVRVSAGQLYCAATPSGGTSQRVRVSMDTYEDVTISANSTGSTRYDFVYAVISASALANPGANKDDVVTLTTSRSTSSATDNGTPPTYGYKLAVVTVANGASSITNSNITDSRTRTGANMISDSITLPTTTTVSSKGLTNPYKFFAYRNAAFNTPAATTAKISHDSELFDTGSNYDTAAYKFTAPIAGFYWVAAAVTGGSFTRGFSEIWKNGAIVLRGHDVTGSASGGTAYVGGIIQLAANDYIEHYAYTASSGTGITGSAYTYLQGFLVSAT